ncbi:MAG: nucleoside monophosphate kinase [Anaerolineae bacterium]|nr:nucleoside monophosphate kinase [Anaerolineae bacterium]
MGFYLILMGPQGAGKGVQAGFIRQDHGNIPHISTGDLFRAMKTRTDAFAQEIQAILASGKLVSDEITCKMVEERLAQPDAHAGALFDGFPRTIPQAEWLEKYLSAKGEKIAAALLLELDLYDAFRRTFGRVTGADGSSYNIYSNSEGITWNWVDHESKAFPPRLEATVTATGEKLARRADDASADAIIKRLDAFQRDTAPLLPYYEQRNLLRRVDAAQSIEAVTAAIRKILG